MRKERGLLVHAMCKERDRGGSRYSLKAITSGQARPATTVAVKAGDLCGRPTHSSVVS